METREIQDNTGLILAGFGENQKNEETGKTEVVIPERFLNSELVRRLDLWCENRIPSEEWVNAKDIYKLHQHIVVGSPEKYFEIRKKEEGEAPVVMWSFIFAEDEEGFDFPDDEIRREKKEFVFTKKRFKHLGKHGKPAALYQD